jgi:hypothetical protein
MVERLPALELRKVTALHIWNAVQKLSAGFKGHPFWESTRYDLVADKRLDPKAVFGVAATEALGFDVLPGHFSGDLKSVCFRALRDAGYLIVPKGQAPAFKTLPLSPEDRQWVEGRPALVAHLEKERADGLPAAKKVWL